METRKARDGTPGQPPLYVAVPAVHAPEVGTARLGGDRDPDRDGHIHIHDFLIFVYFDHGGGSVRVGRHEWQVATGDLYVIAPGEIAGVGRDAAGLALAEGRAVYFTSDALGAAPGSFLSWRAHPLLYPFVRGASGGVQRLSVPPADRPAWSLRLETLERELSRRDDGYREAALALLTLLLVDIGRLAADVAAEFRLKEEPLLADVFGYIEQHYPEPISLRDVAGAVNLTPGHLTTVVRRKTGRPVQEWITARRLAEARRLLATTALGIEEVGREVGYGDPGYFSRVFRRLHGVTPLAWRHAGLAIEPGTHAPT